MHHPPHTSERRRDRLSVRLDSNPDALRRLLGTCRRRGLDVLALDYVRDDAGKVSRAELLVEGDGFALRFAARWLEQLVDVRSIESGEPPVAA
jgi:acetolactate synthase regulatory subunit